MLFLQSRSVCVWCKQSRFIFIIVWKYKGRCMKWKCTLDVESNFKQERFFFYFFINGEYFLCLFISTALELYSLSSNATSDVGCPWFIKLARIDKGRSKLFMKPLSYLIVAKEPGLYESSDKKLIQFYLQAQGCFSVIKTSRKY